MANWSEAETGEKGALPKQKGARWSDTKDGVKKLQFVGSVERSRKLKGVNIGEDGVK